MVAGRGKILYVGSFRFPEGDAGAARVLGIGKALRQVGYEVLFAGGEPTGRLEDHQPDGRFVYQGFPYYSTGEIRSQPVPPMQRILRYLATGSVTLRWLRSSELSGLVAIIVYHGTTGFVGRLRSFCRRRGVALIADCTEWPDPSHLVGGPFGLVRWDNEIRLRALNPGVGNIIAISRFFQTFYERRACHVIRIPPLVDLQDEKWRFNAREWTPSERLKLVYAGSPGKKDLLANVIRGLESLWEQSYPVVLNLLGPSPAVVATCMGSSSGCLRRLEANGALLYHGHVPQNLVPERLGQMDFSVLLRPNARYAEAGFPTKLVESLSAGVPILVNKTGDISEIVRDETEGVILADHSPEKFVEGVKRTIALPREHWMRMRWAATRRARLCFDYRVYQEPISEFVKECIALALKDRRPS